MARDKAKPYLLDQEKYDADDNMIICLGDSAVGKSELLERFLMDGFGPQQLSTYALTLYKHTAMVDGRTVLVDFWDTVGQGRFQSMHASYYHKAHACLMVRHQLETAGAPGKSSLRVCDVQRKVIYKNLSTWYTELREFRPEIPCIIMTSKIDADMKMTQKSFNFPGSSHCPCTSSQLLKAPSCEALQRCDPTGCVYKRNSWDFMDKVLQELENFDLELKEEDRPDQEQKQEQHGRPDSLAPS